MKIGDLVQATWSDGLVLTGSYSVTELGYVVLIGPDNKKIICNPNCVTLEVLNESASR